MKKLYLVYPEKIGTIAPEIYGHFAEHIGGVMRDGVWVGKDSPIPNVRGFRKDLLEMFRKINPAVVRWPGGCFAETYHWRDGIGEDRPVRTGWWTEKDKRYETNEVGTHEFMDFCEMVGAKPYVAVNVTSITPMEAREWMEYCISPKGSTTLALEREKNGHPEPFNVAFWGVGNENWGGGGAMSADSYAMEYRRFATVMANMLCESGGVLFAGGANGGDYDWTHDLAGNLGKMKYKGYTPVHGMSIHYYCGKAGDPLNFTKEEWYELLGKSEKMNELIERHYAIVKGFKMEEKMKLVVDEWGCWHPEGSGPSEGYNLFEQQSTMRDAVIAAITLNIFNNQCDKVRMANVAQLCNNLHSLFLAAGEHCIATPNYYVFDMFKHHQGAEAIRTVIEDNEELESKISVSSSVKDGILTMTVANYSESEPVELAPELLGAKWAEVVSAELLCGDAPNAHNTFENPEAVVSKPFAVEDVKRFTIPAASVAVVRVRVEA